jgi:DNA-binding CsgD family transcriptional regulator
MLIVRCVPRDSGSSWVRPVSSSSPELAGATGPTAVPTRLAILVVDDGRRCLEVNLAACRLLGLPRSAALGRTVDDFLTSGMRKRLDHVWRAFREGGGHAGPFELSSQAAEAHEVNLSVVANVLPGRHLLILSATESDSNGVEATRQPLPEVEARAARVNSGARFGRGGPTPREREVLALLAAGATDDQIAEMLVLSPATVQTHVRNAKAKLGARTRAQAVAMALQHGMISVS